MANDTRSGRRAGPEDEEETNKGKLRQHVVGEKRPINSRSIASDASDLRRSARESSSKKMIPGPSSTRKSERLKKKTSPTLAVRRKSERVEKQKMLNPLRRSGRTKNQSSPNPSGSKSSVSSGSKQKPKQDKSVKQLTFEAEEKRENKSDCHEEPKRTDKSTQEGSGNNGGGEIDKCFEGNHLDCKEVSKDGIVPSEDAKAEEMLETNSRLSGPVEELLENNVTLGSSVPSNATTYETQGDLEGVQSDCCGEETRDKFIEYSCSSSQRSQKEFPHFDGSVDRPDRESEGIANKRRKVINYVDHQPSKSEGEKLSSGNEEGKSGDPVDGPGSKNIESEKIRKLRDEQRSLHLFLKPEMAKLCEILCLPDDVRIMVDNFLEYVMNNHHVNGEPVPILQAFQISLCWTAASLVKHKLDHKASIMLAKRLLNFDCTKEQVDCIYSMLRCLKKIFLYRTGNSNVTGSPKDKRLAVIRSCSPNDVMRTEKLKVFNSGYNKRSEELKWLNEKHLKGEEGVKSSAQDELLSIVAPKEPGTGIEYLQTCDQAQHHYGPKNVALVSDHVGEEKSFENLVEKMPRTGTGVGLSEATDTNSPLVVPCSSLVEAQTPLVKHACANEMDIMASEDRSVSRNEGHNIAENEYDIQGSIISKHSHSSEQNSYGATSMADEGERCENLSCESHNGCGKDTVTLVLPSSNGEICDGETSDVSRGGVPLEVHQISGTNDGQDEVPSRQGKLDGTILRKPVCGFSLEVKANGVGDGVTNMASLNSQSLQENIPSVISTCVKNCENAAQIHEADDSNGSNNAYTPLSDERIASLNSKSPEEYVPSVIATCMPSCQNSAQIHDPDDSNGSNNAVNLNSTLSDERIVDGATVSVLDREVPVGLPGTVNFTRYPANVSSMDLPSSMEQITEGAVNVSILDREFSRPSGTASPNNGPQATTLLNQPSLLQQNPGVVSSTIPEGQIPVEVPQTSCGGATLCVLGIEVPVEMPRTVNCTDYPENATPLNSSSMVQISERGSVNVSLLNLPSLEQQIVDSVSLSIPDGQVPVRLPEASLEVAESYNDREQLTDSVLVDKSTISDQQERVHRTMTEYTFSQETPVSRPDNQSNHASLIMEPPEQVPQFPFAELFSSNQDPSNLLSMATGIEHQPTSVDALSSLIPEASIEVPNQAVVQPGSNSEHDSHSHQVEHPVSNPDVDSLMLGGVRTQPSDTRNLSTPSEINDHPIQTATQSASEMLPPLCLDPLNNELERIRKLTEQSMRNHENMKLQLKSDFEKEFEELVRKYRVKYQEIEVEFQQRKKNLDSSLNIVLVNKMLAEAFRSKCMDLKVSGVSGMQQDASLAQQSFQFSRQQSATWPCPVASPSSCGPSAASLQSSSTMARSQAMVPPRQAAYNTSGVFSSVSARPPRINSISSPSGNLQTGGEIRSPAPHLQPYRPSPSAPASSLPTVPHGILSQPASSSFPATSPAFSHCLPQLTPAMYHSDPHRGRWPENASGLPTPNLSANDLRMNANSKSGMNLPNVLSQMSDVASLSLSRLGSSSSMPANSAYQATSDVVCLSDDE